MRTDDPVILRRLEQIEAACAGLRQACGFPDPHQPTSRQEGRKAISEDTARAFTRQFWDDYPDLAVLADELTDRGLTAAQAADVIQAERERRQA